LVRVARNSQFLGIQQARVSIVGVDESISASVVVLDGFVITAVTKSIPKVLSESGMKLDPALVDQSVVDPMFQPNAIHRLTETQAQIIYDIEMMCYL
jgi:hypothetical protein